jgi:hypothetical protein
VKNQSSIKRIYQNLAKNIKILNNRKIGILKKKYPQEKRITDDCLKKINQGTPFIAGKIGGAELMALEYEDHWLKLSLIKKWSWERPAQRLSNNAGFFPVRKNAFLRWATIMKKSIAAADFLCAWQNDSFLKLYEKRLIEELAPKSLSITNEMLGWGIVPSISNLNWLVISPFEMTMRKQLPKMKEVYDPSGVLTIDWDHLVKTCQFLRCPFQSHLEPSPYTSWEDGLEKITKEVSSRNFDIALIGAGAWSLPLAARIKQMGKSAIHMGGELQIIFGIKGKRWDNHNIYNAAWVRPTAEETPSNISLVEDGCYW